jgi:hypothetical protein
MASELDYQTGFVPVVGTARLEYVGPTKLKLTKGWISIKNSGVWLKTFVRSDIFDTIDSRKMKPDTVYNVYLKDGDPPSFNYLQDPHDLDTDLGIETMKGNSTYIIVGKVWTNEKGQFEDTPYSRCVISWFNRKTLDITDGISEDLSFPSDDKKYQVGLRKIKFLTWGGETVMLWSQLLFGFNEHACTSIEGLFATLFNLYCHS